MKSSKRIPLFFAAAALAFAHNGIEHVLGTVKSVTAASIVVETVKHETTALTVDPTTEFLFKGAKAALKDLKVGDRVAIDGKDGSDKKLHAISVRWGATSPAASKDAHKMDPNMKM